MIKKKFFEKFFEKRKTERINLAGVQDQPHPVWAPATTVIEPGMFILTETGAKNATVSEGGQERKKAFQVMFSIFFVWYTQLCQTKNF